MKKIVILIAVIITTLYAKGQDSTANASLDSAIQKNNVLMQKFHDIDSIENKLKSAALDLNKAGADKNKLNTEITKLKKDKEKIIKELLLLDNQANSIKIDLENAKGKNDSLVSENKNLENEKERKINTNDSLDNANKALQKSNDSTANELKEALVELSKQKDSLEIIAVITKQDSAVVFTKEAVFKNEFLYSALQSNNAIAELKSNVAAGKNKKVRVLQIRAEVQEGLMLELIVKTSDGIFRNKLSPIDLVHIGERIGDKLYLEQRTATTTDSTPYIVLGDVLTYSPLKSYNSIPYSEFEIKLDTLEKSYEIKESTSINTYFNLAFFTDIKGISGEANGLAQIAGSAKFITSTRNVHGSSLIPFNYVSFQGGLAKFDNEFKGTFISPEDSIDRKDLFQRSQYNVGIKMNILHWVRSPYPRRLIQDIQLNAGFNFIGSRIADTLVKRNDTLYRTATHNQWFIEPSISFTRNKNLNMCLSLPFYYQNIKASSGIANSSSTWWAAPSINLMYYSKRSTNSKLFFRYVHNIDLKKPKNAFVQLQLGYSVSVTDLLNGK